jgi:hypothetical protein
VIHFNLPTLAELDRIGSKERLNLFRQYFSASRYNRLIIQQLLLIKSAYDESPLFHERDYGSALNNVTNAATIRLEQLIISSTIRYQLQNIELYVFSFKKNKKRMGLIHFYSRQY